MLAREADARRVWQGSGRRRRLWSIDEKHGIVAETRKAGASVSLIARRHDVNTNMIFTWRREFDKQERDRGAENASFVPALISADEVVTFLVLANALGAVTILPAMAVITDLVPPRRR